MNDRNIGSDYPTTIGADASFKGELKFDQSVRLLGHFEGAIETKGNLLVAEGASLQGEVKAGDINVDGNIKGNLNATGKVCLSASANLEGDLNVARLEVADGAVFVGRCVVGTNANRPTTAPAPPGSVKPSIPEGQKDKGIPQPAVIKK